MDKRMKQLLVDLAAQGFTTARTGKNHTVVRGADGRRVTTISSTPSDARGWANAMSYLKRAGFVPRG